MKKKNKHIMKIACTGEQYVSVIKKIPLADLQPLETASDGECKRLLDMRCQENVDRTGHPFHHKAADGTIVTPDPTVDYLLSRIPVDDQEYVKQQWQQYIKPDALPAVPVDLDWYKKHPITIEDLNGSSGRFHE